jgi:hypothetical protein
MRIAVRMLSALQPPKETRRSLMRRSGRPSRILADRGRIAEAYVR